ncbi:MAG: helical backbone metal receptor [Smithella sp.]
MRKKLTRPNEALILLVNVFLVFFCVNISCAHTATDEIGRSVNISSVPRRIVSLAPGITETLYELSLDDKILGVTNYCNWPLRARQKPQIGGFTNPSIEKIVSLKPDLIIATADGNRKDTMNQLARTGLAVYVINPYDTDRILKNILHIGEITDKIDVAGKLVEKLQKRLDNIAAQTRNKRRPRVFFRLVWKR